MADHFIRKETRRKPRSCRGFITDQGWWETVRDMYGSNRFYETFRMSRTTCYYILKLATNSKKGGDKFQFLQTSDLL